MDAKLAKLQVTSKRIHAAGGAQRLRGSMMAWVLYGRCLYSAECHYITKHQTQRMRRVMCTAMGDAQGRTPNSVRLPAESGGKWEPDPVRIKRIVKHGQNEVAVYEVPTGYWDSPQGTTVHTWTTEGNQVLVSGTQGLARQVAGAARAALWRAQAPGPRKRPRRGCNRGFAGRTQQPRGCSHDEYRAGGQTL